MAKEAYAARQESNAQALAQVMRKLAVFLLFLLVSAALPAVAQERVKLRIGHFPNITHGQALVARQLARQGKGWFEERLGAGVEVEWFVYNAGPSAMEALLADSIDATYVGPNPVLNAHIRAKGTEIRVIAGAALGGAALVVHGDGSIAAPGDFRGRKVATPQLGNTQDVAARAWLKKQGFNISQAGGDVFVIPTANPDQLALFRQLKLDAVWTVEPWVSRLEFEAEGKVFLEQPDVLTTVLATSRRFLREQPELAHKFVAAHAELTRWIVDHPGESRELCRAELKDLTKAEMPAPVAERAWARLKFTTEVSREQFETLLREAQGVGFLEDAIPLDKLVVKIDEHSTAAASSIVAHRSSQRRAHWKLMAAGVAVLIVAGSVGFTLARTRQKSDEKQVAAELQLVRPAKLAIDGVSKWHRDGVVETQALDAVSLQVDEGEFVCIVGPSGCGKSTLLNLIAGLEFPDGGAVKVDGRTVAGPGRERMMMFQEAALFPWKSVLGNVLFGLKRKPGLKDAERLEVARYYIKLVGLERFEQSNIHELSGGMKQRAALARALAPNPRLLLMDEPFGALDAMTREHFYGDLQKIWALRHKTIIFVTHNVREAACLGDRVVLFSPNPGRICKVFKIDLPRPRDFNSPSLSEHVTEITRALKQYRSEHAGDGRET